MPSPFATRKIRYEWLVLPIVAALVACGGAGGGGSPIPPGPPSPQPTLTPIPLPTGSTAYYLTQVQPADGEPAYVSDPVFLRFSQQPDVTADPNGNPQGTTISAISVAGISGGAPAQPAVRFIYAATNPQLGPDVIGVKFYAVAGAKYRIAIASSATSASGISYSGPASFVATLPTTPPLPAPVPPQNGSTTFYGLVPQVASGTSLGQEESWVSALHPQVVRIGVDATEVESTPGAFTYTTLDSHLAGAGRPAIVLIVQYNAPGWANGTNGPGPAGAGYIFCHANDYANFVDAVVDHVLKEATAKAYPPPAAFEIGNEPDTQNFWDAAAGCPHPFTSSADPTPYLPYLEDTYAVAKPTAQHDGYGNIPFLNAGVASDANDETYFDKIVNALAANPGSPFLDAYAVHIYAFADPNANAIATRSWESFQVLIDDGNYAQSQGFSKPFWVTEGGFQVNPYCADGVDPQTQAYFLTEDYNRMAQLTVPSVAAFTYFNLQDNQQIGPVPAPADPCFANAGFGLVDYNGNERPSFAAYERL